MQIRFYAAMLLSILSAGTLAQDSNFRFPAAELKGISKMAIEKIKAGESSLQGNESDHGPASGFLQLEARRKAFKKSKFNVPEEGNGPKNPDTLFVTDTRVITGNWVYPGTIVIANQGSLHFRNATATILGDIYLLGSGPALIADSSTINIPQAYFYQRMVFATGGGRVSYRNSTIDHSGLSHNILFTDSARLELLNVTNKGFTTNALYGRSSVFVNGTNEAGEYVILDESKLEFRNASTLLLWHHLPEGSAISHSFPKGDTTFSYRFNRLQPGISGIQYDIWVDSCRQVMWGVMPENNTETELTDSEIRAIGLWFMGTDTVNVSGLVNNSTYDDYRAPLTDRELRLVNSSVKTWSIYPMEQARVNLSGCIVGEVGSGGRSSVMGQQYLCDGSGGYVWASDSSLLINGFSFTSGYVRSQANGMLIYAYSSLASGYPSALQESMMMVLQCTLPDEPRALDKSVVWYATIDHPFEAEAGTIVPVTGSAWIDKSETSNWMEFGSFRLFFRQTVSEEWTQITVDSIREKRNEVIGLWNTAGLPAGHYILKLVLVDNLGNQAEAVKSVMLQPAFATENREFNLPKVYPVPADDYITVELPGKCSKAALTIFDLWGRKCLDEMIHDCSLLLNVGSLTPGLYLLHITGETGSYCTRIAVN